MIGTRYNSKGCDLEVTEDQSGEQGLYAQLCFCLPAPGLSCTYVINLMEAALKQLALLVPWVAGETKIDKFRRVSVRKTGKIPLGFRMTCHPAYSDLRRAKFSFKGLEEEWILPCSISDNAQDAVFQVQINFIPYGLVLVFRAQHIAMQTTEMSLILSVLNELCNGKALSEEQTNQISLMNSKYSLQTSHEPFEADQELEKMVSNAAVDAFEQFDLDLHIWKVENGECVKNGKDTRRNGTVTEQLHEQLKLSCPSTLAMVASTRPIWFYFSLTNAEYLKSEANRELGVGFISTDDIVSAFTYITITLARQSIYQWDNSEEVVMARSSDIPSKLGSNTFYPSHTSKVAYTKSTVQELIDSPLSKVAERLHSASQDNANIAKHSASLAARTNHERPSSIVASLCAERDLVLSSWTFVDAYNWTFGIEHPEAVRHLMLKPCQGLGYVMPRNLYKRPGDPVVGMCLTPHELGALRNVPLFKNNALYIG